MIRVLKRGLICLLALAVLQSVSWSISAESFIYGDVNGDKAVDMKDVLLLRKSLAKLTAPGYNADAADVLTDKVADMKDVLLLRRAILGSATIPQQPSPDTPTHTVPPQRFEKQCQNVVMTAYEMNSDGTVYKTESQVRCNDSGNLIVKEMLDRRGNASVYQQFTLSGNGNVKYRDIFDYDDFEYSYTYNYDASGRKTSTLCYGADGKLSWTEECVYNGNTMNYSQKGTDGTPYIRQTYTYDSKNNLQKMESFDADDAVIYRELYTYENNNVSSVEYLSYGVKTFVTCTYENGKLKKETCKRKDGNIEWENIYAYDKEGRLGKMVTYYGDSSVTKERTAYTYDLDGNELSCVFYNEAGRAGAHQLYAYDDKGNRISAKCYDGEGNLSWWYTYEYSMKYETLFKFCTEE